MAVHGLPPIKALLDPVLQAFAEHGGELANERLFTHIVQVFALDQTQATAIHGARAEGRTELEYRLAWARTKLKAAGLLEKRGARVWALTPLARDRLNLSGQRS